MPAKSSSQAPGRGQPGAPQSRMSNPSRNDDSGSGGKLNGSLLRIYVIVYLTHTSTAETPARRRLQKAASTINMNTSNNLDAQSVRTGAGPRSGGMGRRRLSIRDQKPPQEPRPQDSSRWRSVSSCLPPLLPNLLLFRDLGPRGRPGRRDSYPDI